MRHHLAQLNIARWIVDPEGPVAQTFLDQLDEVNGLGDASPGFVWRMQDDSGDATDIPTPFGDEWIANLTVWESVEALRAFTFRGRHARAMQDRRTWFEDPPVPTAVLWWVPVGHRPTLEQAAERLELLRSDGPGPRAFTFRALHPAPGGDDA